METLDGPGEVIGSPSRPSHGGRLGLSTLVVVVCAASAAAWWGGAWSERRDAQRREARAVHVTFALLSGSVVNGNDPANQEVSWSALLVNTAPTPIKVESADWGGTDMPSAAGIELAPGGSQLLVFTSTFACAVDGTTSTLPLPVPTLRLRTSAGDVVRRRVDVRNPSVWNSTVFQACDQVAVNVGSSVSPTISQPIRLVGRVLHVGVVLVNDGPVESDATTVSIVADGFATTSVPASVPRLVPGASARVDLRIRVSDCSLARSGGIDGLVVGEGRGVYGAEPSLVRGLDRLVTASCGA